MLTDPNIIQNLTADLKNLGISAPIHLELLRERSTHAVYRLIASERRFILKFYTGPHPSLEGKVYSLLQQLGISTLPVYLQQDNYLLIEDLETSPTWRLAIPADMGSAAVGQAVAAWYRQLHRTGRQALQQNDTRMDFLTSWVDGLEEPSLVAAGQKFDLAHVSAWQAAIQSLPALKKVFHSFPQTFNYNDFADENLALTRDPISPQGAIVFDYDCFSIGTAFSDYRNVLFALKGPAREAFCEASDPVDPGEEVIDNVLSVIENIISAASRSHFPTWAAPSIASIHDGKFGRDLDQALALCKMGWN
jgi:hypothetical protein